MEILFIVIKINMVAFHIGIPYYPLASRFLGILVPTNMRFLYLVYPYEFSYSFKNILLRFINTISTVFFNNILTEHVLPYCLLSAQTSNFRQFDKVQCMLWNLSVDNWKWSSSSRTVGNIVVGKFSMCKCIFPLLWLILANTTN